MSLTARYPDSPGTRVHLTKRPRLLVFSVDRHTGSVQLLPILWPNMCLEHTATEVATEFQDAVTVRRSENRAVVRPLPLGAINVGAGGFLFFSARSPLRKLPSAPPPPPQSRPRNLAAPETSSTHRRKTTGAAHRAQRRRSFIELLPRRVITVSFLFLRSWRTRGVHMPRETRICFL